MPSRYYNNSSKHYRTNVVFYDRLFAGMTWKCVQSTCVFETDFGLSINCGLKKSGLFRVRNLGGLKGYVGVGKRTQSIYVIFKYTFYQWWALTLS